MNDEPTLSLVAGELRSDFWPGSGMLVVSFRRGKDELLRRVDDLETARAKGSTAGIPLLYPWANRLASLHYHAAGRDVDLDPASSLLHFDSHGLSMHGVPWGQLSWQIAQAKQDSLLARLDWERPNLLAVFPYPHRLEIAANLTPESLTLQTTLFADAGSPVPICFGFHPYFGIPSTSRCEWRLRLPAMQRLSLDSRGIPTGEQEPFGPFDSLLGQTGFDDGFALLDGPSSFSLSAAAYTITVTFIEGYSYAQVFAPKGMEFVALEPMTAPTSALTSGRGLRILEPGAQFRTSFRIAVIAGG